MAASFGPDTQTGCTGCPQGTIKPLTILIFC